MAPVYLKDVGRTQGLLERELRQQLACCPDPSLPLYPEERPCKRPTTRRGLDVLEPIQRHVVTLSGGEEQILVTELTPLQRRIARLLGLDPNGYGH